ncbi:hypothetical protein [Paenibacillus arenosi]|uniref:Uncharacterized protein n=1 Tax=Paenibacillus arenosi TaxID=2774142 RepID=A0ABR9AW80_9BACL|nr:hypothetical protein [Paenibacillus arenosi]MBD8498360.1 hypothetical protein [Paenibacillus arenosi]
MNNFILKVNQTTEINNGNGKDSLVEFKTLKKQFDVLELTILSMLDYANKTQDDSLVETVDMKYFLVNLWTSHKISKEKVSSYVPKFITQVDCETILATPQD